MIHPLLPLMMRQKGMIAEAEAKELEAMGGYDDIVPGVSFYLLVLYCY